MAPTRSPSPQEEIQALADLELDATLPYASRYIDEVPTVRMRDDPLPARVVQQFVRDERALDSNPRLNLASFVTTYMEPQVESLMMESLAVNFIDAEEYPSTTEMQQRCVSMIWHLFHGDSNEDATPTGSATVGSSEAIMLAGLALKRRWEARRREGGKSTDKPNLVLGANAQVCWIKFCRYFDVEARFVALEKGQYILTPEKAVALVDDNTIGVCAILGSTYDGAFEDVAGLNAALLARTASMGAGANEIPIHVDAASGGFVAPFTTPSLEWDFRLSLVDSINVSGHKYGLVYPGVGWVLWRNNDVLPKELVFHTNYLGSDQPSITMNFSKGASQIVAQYYQLCRLGMRGYTKIMQHLVKVGKHLEKAVQGVKSGNEAAFELISSCETGLPLVAFSLARPLAERGYTEFDVADRLRQHGWVLPAYSYAANAEDVHLLRAVVREDMTIDLCTVLAKDLERAIDHLDAHHVAQCEQLTAAKAAFQTKHMPHRDTAKATAGKAGFHGRC